MESVKKRVYRKWSMEEKRAAVARTESLRAVTLGHRFELDLMEVTELPSGNVYPALRRLERDQLVVSLWKPKAEASGQRRPVRRYYEVTAEDKSAAAAITERFPLLAQLLAVKPE
jgi:DNA-binding PadR family transcriptional regulator